MGIWRFLQIFFVLFFGAGVPFHTLRGVKNMSDGLCLILHCVISYLLEFLTAFPFAPRRANPN